MRKCFILVSLLAVIGLFLVNPVSSDQSPLTLDKAANPGPGIKTSAWTIMVYLNGDNDLESAGINDFLALAAAGSSPDVNIVVQFDRIGDYDTGYGDWSGTKRFYIAKGKTPTAENAEMNAGEVNMGDPAELVNFVYWAKTNYPAANYALILWHHGNGRNKSKAELWQDWQQRNNQGLIFKDLCRDDTAGGDSLDMAEVKRALSSCGGANLIGFGGSLMGMVEAAYEIKDYGQVMVGHGEIEPRGGWPFDTIMRDLTANPSWTALQLGSAIIDRYYETYGPNVTQSAIDLTGMAALVKEINTFAHTALISWDNNQTMVKNAAADVITGIEHTVISKKSALPIYFPRRAAGFDPGYNGPGLTFPGDSYWTGFLQGFYNSMAGSWIADMRAAAAQFYHPAFVDLYNFCQLIMQTQDDYYTESLIGQEFFGEGSAQNFQEDDDYITYDLPFDFPYFGTIIEADSTVYISSNGYIDFDSNSSHTDHTNTSSELASNKRIAPCWADLRTDGEAQEGEDVYIIANEDIMVIRWVAETYGDEEPVNFEVVLFRNGHIQFNYGGGNADISPWNTAPTIGISRGDSENYYLSEYNGETWLMNVNSDRFEHLPSITVTSPDGGEEWAIGSAHAITWTSIGDVGDVMIEYSSTGGETWESVVNSTNNDGFHRWIIPDDESEDCQVRVSECGVDSGPADDSDQVFSIVEPSTAAITVISPNGGEKLVVDTVCEVKWANSGEVGNVKIDYSTNGGESWTNIVESTDNTGKYNWTVPDNTSTDCLIRVSETDGNPSDISDEIFWIVTPATITVTSPNGGEEWDVGSAHNITWNASPSVGDVRIDYTSTGGETWTNIVTYTYNDGSYTWTVPNTPSQNCRVRVSKADSETGPSDVSDENFTINSATSITVTSPNGGEILEVESTFEINWTSSGEVGNVKIDYSTNGGETWTNIVESMDNNGRYNWTVPGNTSHNCVIKVSETDGNPYDISDAVFWIVASTSITVTSPNGGENWAAGTSHNITWTYTGVIGSVLIEYSTNGGNSWTTVVTTTPNTGSYNWFVPNTPSTNCLVRIKGYDSDGNPTDVSNSSFTITNN